MTYMPGDTRELVKAEIAATEGSDKSPIQVYFNPKELTVDKPVQWQVHKSSKDEPPTLEYTTGQPKTMNVELMFDMYEEKGDVYATYISRLEKLALIDSGLSRPPLCTFTWGSNMPIFKGVIEDLNVKYTLFLPDGTPTRATATMKWKQSNTLLNKQEADDANKAAAKQQPGTNAPAGQRMDTTANAVGSTPRATANANGVDDMQHPPAGNYQKPPGG
jgi:hypothetical protein